MAARGSDTLVVSASLYSVKNATAAPIFPGPFQDLLQKLLTLRALENYFKQSQY